MHRNPLKSARLGSIALGLIFGLATSTFALERLTQEEIQQVGKILSEASGKPSDLQIKVETDLTKGSGVKHEQLGALVLPDAKLTLATLEAADKEIVPVGIFWLKGLSAADGDKTIAEGKHRVANVKHGDESFKARYYLIGAKKANGKLQLVVFGADKKEILEPKLEAVNSTDSDDKTPIYVTAEKKDDSSALVHLSILGKYKASVDVSRAD